MSTHRYSLLGLVLVSLGLVLGIIALLLSFVPCVGFLSLAPGLLGIVFSGIALALALKGRLPRSLAAAALSIAVLGTAIGLVWGGIMASVTQNRKYEQTFDEYRQPAGSVQVTQPPPSPDSLMLPADSLP